MNRSDKKKPTLAHYTEVLGEEKISLAKKSIDYFSMTAIAKWLGVSPSTCHQIAHAIYDDRGHPRLLPREILQEHPHLKVAIANFSKSNYTCAQVANIFKESDLTNRIRPIDVAEAFGSAHPVSDLHCTAAQIEKRNNKRKRLNPRLEVLTAAQIREIYRQKQLDEDEAQQVLVSRIAADLRGRHIAPADAETMYGKEAAQQALDQLGAHEKMAMLQDIDRPAQTCFIRDNWRLPDARLAFFLDTSRRQIAEARKRIDSE